MSTVLYEETSRTLHRELQRWSRRLRLTRSALWGPRGIIAGLTLGIAAAVLSRVRPWLLPDQIAWATGLLTLGVLLAIFAWLWLRPQPIQRAARYFDRRFALKERTSTALELSAGTLSAPPELVARQLADAVHSAQGVSVATRLPMRVRWLELAAMVALAAVFAALLLSHNPQTEQLRAERALEQAISEQAASLERQLDAIDRNSALTPEEREALRRPLEEARAILEQPGISQQEAVAALSEAQQRLSELSEGLLDADRQALREAARALAGAETTAGLAEALNRPDLAAAANAAEQAARDLDPAMTAAERDALAEQLERAANALASSNPALADQLREAAEALREGDMEAAQEALSEAAEALREQQEQLDESALSEQAQAAEQETRAGQQQVAQAGQRSSGEQQAQASPQSSQQPGSNAQQSQPQQSQQSQQGQTEQSGETGEQSERSGLPLGAQSGESAPSDSASQPGQSGQDPQPGDGQSGAEAESGDTQQGAGQPGGSTSGESGAEGGPASASQAGQEGAGLAGPNAQPPGAGENAASAAGQGEGGAGVDSTEGRFGLRGDTAGSGLGGGEGEPRPFEAEFAPSSIGGSSDTPLDVEGQLTDIDTIPSREGEFAENPAGQSRLGYQSVLGDYRNFVSDALESGRIPLIQRDIIHDYFSSLEP